MFADRERTKAARVLMTADCVGGVWTYTIELIRSLQRAGIEVALATMGGLLSNSQLKEMREFRGFQVYESRFPLEWMEDPWSGVAEAGEWLLDLESKLKPSLIHLNGYAHGSLPWNAPVVMVGHSCVLSWWRSVKSGNAPPEWDLYRNAVTRGLRAADIVIAPTQWMMSSLQEFYGPLPRTIVIPNARSSGFFGCGDKQPYVFSMGRIWDEAKNFKLLATATKDLTWPCYLAGPLELLGCRTAHEFTGINLLGSLEQHAVAKWLTAAAIYAHPAKYEPFGLSVLEAALSGCALVLADIGSLREVWGAAAWFFPPNEPAELRASLETLIGDESLRVEMASRAIRRAVRYAPENMATPYLDAYKRAMHHHESKHAVAAGGTKA